MKRFKFNLQPVLVIREREERQAMEAYARALAEQRRLMAALYDAQRELGVAYSESRRRLLDGAPVAFIMQQQLYCAHLEERCKAAAQSSAAAEEKVKTAVQAMTIASQRREVVEKFRGNQRAAYDRALSIEEQKMLDEFAGRNLERALSWRTSDHD